MSSPATVARWTTSKEMATASNATLHAMDALELPTTAMTATLAILWKLTRKLILLFASEMKNASTITAWYAFKNLTNLTPNAKSATMDILLLGGCVFLVPIPAVPAAMISTTSMIPILYQVWKCLQ